MQADRVQVVVQQAAAGNVEALVALVQEFTPGLRLMLGAHLDQPKSLVMVEIAVWSVVRTRLGEWLPDTPFPQWLQQVAVGPVTTFLAQADRRAIDIQDALSHQIIEHCRKAIAEGSELGVVDLPHRFAALPDNTRTLLLHHYRERQRPAALAASLMISELELARSLATARAACDWTGVAKPPGAGDRLIPPLTEDWLNGTIDVDSRALLAINVARDGERARQFARQVRLHLALTAALAPFTHEEALAIARQTGMGAGDSGRVMMGDGARTTSGPRAPTSDPRRAARMTTGNQHHVNLDAEVSRPSSMPWIIGGLMVLAGIFAAVVMSLGSGDHTIAPVRPAEASTAPPTSAPVSTTPLSAPASGGGELPENPQKIELNKQPPKVVLLGITSGGHGYPGVPMELRALTANIPNVTEIEYWAGDQRIGSAKEAPFSLTWTPSRTGEVLVHARAMVGSMNKLSSESLAITMVTALGSGQLTREWWTGIPGERVADGLDRFIRAQGSGPVEADVKPLWSNGYGTFDPQARRLSGFTALPEFHHNTWRGSEKLPDDKLGFLMLSAHGGHPGNSQAFAAVRRFTVPHDGQFTISGTLKRPGKDGDGVRALALLDGQPPLGDWDVTTGEVATTVARVHLKAGQTLDFVVDCKSSSGSDYFVWSPQVAGIEGTNGTWNAAADFSGPPIGRALENQFAAPKNWGENYFQRMSGYITPPISGEYVFWISSDNESELWLSIDDTREQRKLIASATRTNYQVWDQEPRQRSAAITLSAGKRYYITALHKEGVGSDFLDVGWQFPNGHLERPIPGIHLTPAPPAPMPTGPVVGTSTPTGPAVAPKPAPVPAPASGPRFIAGINLGGDAVVVDGNKWLGQKQAEEANTATAANEAAMVALTDLEWVSAQNEAGPVRKNLTHSKQPLTLRDVVYPKGLGVHAPSEVVYSLAGRYGLFMCDVGIDDAVSGSAGSVTFRVLVDGKPVFESGVLTRNSPVQKISVPVAGGKELKLVVTDGGNGRYKDHGDWANPRLLPAGRPSGLAVKSGRKTVAVFNPKPAVDAAMREMQTSSLVGTAKEGLSFTVRAPPGAYQVYVWTTETSAANSRLFDLHLEGISVGKIGALPMYGWEKYGPFPVTIDDGVLDVVAKPEKGVPQLTGIAIFEDAPAKASNTLPTALNLVQNSGFEQGSQFWTFYDGAGVVNTGANSGGFAGQITHQSQGAMQTISGLQPNTTYTLTAWGKVSDGDDYIFIYAKKYGGEDKYSRFTTTVYSQKSITFTTGATHTSVELGFRKNMGDDSGWVDDFSLTVSPAAPVP